MKFHKRTAARLLKVGKNNVKLDSSKLKDIKEAITKNDIRELIQEGLIKAETPRGNSKGRFRKRLAQIKKGMRKNTGSHKGKRVALNTGKAVWMKKVRVLRRVLTENREKLSKDSYWKLRNDIKAGTVKDKKNLRVLIQRKIENEN